jgi:hypothetical protein
VQAFLAARGFPAPPVLHGLAPFGPGHAVAMAFDRRGAPTDARLPGVRRAMAHTLARLVQEAAAFAALPGLPRPPAPLAGTPWPRPHNALFDFPATASGGAWIDAIGADALAVLQRGGTPQVVGHHDWSAKNMRADGDAIVVVYDWDSVFVDREAAIVGSAAAHFPVTWELPVPETPTLKEVAAFVRDYEQARGRPFDDDELVALGAGITYAHAYKARCEHALDPDGVRWAGSSRESLAELGPYTAASLAP